MTASDIKDICTAYRQSKYPRKQIEILSQLYDTTVQAIEEILVSAGFEVKRKRTRRKSTKNILRNSQSGEVIRVCEFCRRYGLDRRKVWNMISYRKYIMQDGVKWDLIQLQKESKQ